MKFLNKKIEVQTSNIFHFKAVGTLNMHYEIRICQKIYDRVTMSVLMSNVWFNLTLFEFLTILNFKKE
jgi:hypothetical protein